jgi:hypothetical protein
MIKKKHRYYPDDIYNSNNWLLRIAIEEQSMVNVMYFNCVTILLRLHQKEMYDIPLYRNNTF